MTKATLVRKHVIRDLLMVSYVQYIVTEGSMVAHMSLDVTEGCILLYGPRKRAMLGLI